MSTPPRPHLSRPRCARCGGILGPDEAPHAACEAAPPRERMTRVLVSLDSETLRLLDESGAESRSEAIRQAVRARWGQELRGRKKI